MIVPARPEHVAAVFARLSRQTKEEMTVVGWTEERTLDAFVEFAAKGEAHAYLRYGRARFVLAFAPVGEMHATFLVGADGFFEESVAHRQELRRFMRETVQRFGAIVCVSNSPDQRAMRWFRMVGATLADAVGTEKIYLWA